VEATIRRSRAPRIATAAIAFVIPWLLLAMGSPFYVENWIAPTLGLWLTGVMAGVSLIFGPKTRQFGGSIVIGTLLGGGLFVLLFGLLVFIAPV
jgi:hypothetical protein